MCVEQHYHTLLSACPPYLCLISGMLIQLAAATAANGTNRPIRGEICYSRREEALKWEGRSETRGNAVS